ncbi:MAG: hypothetical protein AB8F94_04465 [Saprospiraceae bacterium]
MRFILFIMFSLFTILLKAQDSLIVYKTFSDFDNQTGELYTGKLFYQNATTTFKNRFIYFKNKTSGISKDQQKIKINTKEVWGFMINDRLFRMIADTGIPVCLLSQGQLYYYENGLAYLHMSFAKRKKKRAMVSEQTNKNNRNISYPWGQIAYFSKDISSKLYALPTSNEIGARRLLEEYVEIYPELENFFTCIKGVFKFKNRECIKEFNGGSLPSKKLMYSGS